MVTPELTLVLAAHAISTVIIFAVSLYIFFKNPRALLNQLFLIIFVLVAIYEVSFIGAPLAQTYEVAYAFSFLNVFIFFLNAVIIHTLFASVELHKKFRWFIYGFYGVATIGAVASFIFPELYIPSVSEKGIFPWYLTGGPLYMSMSLTLYAALVLPFYHIIRTYVRDPRSPLSKRGMYFILFFVIGIPIAYSNNALVFDYPVVFHPLVGSFLAFALIPIAYGIVADDLLDIRIVAKRALLYSFGIGGSIAVVALLIFLSDLLVVSVSWIQPWMIPVVAGVTAFMIGRIFWVQSAATDRLKYEFVTVATHKLRTPLTQINWGLKTLEEVVTTKEAKDIIAHIEHANVRLIELTNILFETTQESTSEYTYAKDKIELLGLTKGVIHNFKAIIDQKHVTVNIHSDEPVHLVGDERRIRSVVEVFIENALSYSPDNALIQIITYTKGKRAYFSIRDQGIGISSQDQRLIFSKFFRTDAAKRQDTEGVGLGLAMAKNIIRRHGGTIGVESQGEGQGSTFWFWVPVG